MEYAPALDSARQPRVEINPRLTSFDRGQDCNLDRWLEVSWFVEEEKYDLDDYLFDESCLRVS